MPHHNFSIYFFFFFFFFKNDKVDLLHFSTIFPYVVICVDNKNEHRTDQRMKNKSKIPIFIQFYVNKWGEYLSPEFSSKWNPMQTIQFQIWRLLIGNGIGSTTSNFKEYKAKKSWNGKKRIKLLTWTWFKSNSYLDPLKRFVLF